MATISLRLVALDEIISPLFGCGTGMAHDWPVRGMGTSSYMFGAPLVHFLGGDVTRISGQSAPFVPATLACKTFLIQNSVCHKPGPQEHNVNASLYSARPCSGIVPGSSTRFSKDDVRRRTTRFRADARGFFDKANHHFVNV